MINLLQIWVEKINLNDAKQVSDLYHKNGLLLGTFSNIERNGQKLIIDYFENLFTSKVGVEIITVGFNLWIALICPSVFNPPPEITFPPNLRTPQ